MGTPRTISQRAEIDALVASSGTVLIDVASASEPVSIAFSEALAEVSERFPDAMCARIDLAASADVAALFGIDKAPALLLFRAGVGLYAGPASFTGSQLEALLRRALALDMDAVRREMDRERAAMAASSSFRACPTSKRGQFPPQ